MGKMGSATAWGLLGRRHLEMVFLSFDKGKGATALPSLKSGPSPSGCARQETLLWWPQGRDSGEKCRGIGKFGI